VYYLIVNSIIEEELSTITHSIALCGILSLGKLRKRL